jgi:hypothetical protein
MSNEVLTTHFATAMKSGMCEAGITAEQLAAGSDWHLESFKKLLAGQSLPGRDMIEFLAKRLGADSGELTKLAEQDRAESGKRRNSSL